MKYVFVRDLEIYVVSRCLEGSLEKKPVSKTVLIQAAFAKKNWYLTLCSDVVYSGIPDLSLCKHCSKVLASKFS